MNTINQFPQHGAVHAEMVMPVKYRLYRNDAIFVKNFNVGRSWDVRMDGLQLAVGKHNPVNSTLDMELELPDGSTTYVIGRVMEGVR